MKLKSFTDAQNYLFKHIPRNPSSVFAGGRGIKRIKYILNLLDNPQEKLKIIHIAGTSGKSSTAYILNTLLTNLAKHPGLYISPHIYDIRERIHLNGKLITKSKFIRYLNDIIPQIEQTEISPYGKPTYFEILTSLAYYIFYREKVEYAVIETGLGGLLDATNTIENKNKLSIITKLGLDHTEILGKSLTEITQQKVGIIPVKGTVITCTQQPEAEKALITHSKKIKARLYFIRKETNFTLPVKTRIKPHFNFKFLDAYLQDLALGAQGDFQMENAGLALAALIILSKRDNFNINQNSIRVALLKTQLTGRFTKYKINNRTIIIDGAHNGQKMEGFTKSLSKIHPGTKYPFLIAFKNTKDITPMLKLIIPIASSVTVTSFKLQTQDWIHESTKPELIAKTLKDLGFKNYHIEPNPGKALNRLLLSPDKSEIIITGTFYLINELQLKKS